MKIKEIFERDPCAQLELVVKVSELEPEILGRNIENYVITDEIKNYLEDLIDQFVESRSRIPQAVCAWVSGYFGSGKSHFLKVVAALLGNLEIIPPGYDHPIKTLEYLPQKWDLRHTKILEKEFITRPVIINLLEKSSHSDETLSEIIYTSYVQSLGYSKIPWIAWLERELEAKEKLEKFKNEFEKIAKGPWDERKHSYMVARSAIAEALSRIEPELWPTKEDALKGLDEIKENFRITPEELSRILLEDAQKLDKTKGRIVVLLDEVGLYIGNVGASNERLMQLQAIAESFSKEKNAGRLWLIATSQEALEEKIPEITANVRDFERLKDRFQLKYTLTPRNINTVIQKRLLEKKPGETYEKLLDLLESNKGLLAQSIVLKGVIRESDSFEKLPEIKELADYYPFLPSHLLLIQKALSSLRKIRGGGGTGRERSILAIVRQALCEMDEKLIDKNLGHLGTLDLLFDAAVEEVKFLRSDESQYIAEIEAEKSEGNLPLHKVAKALFVLQQLPDIIPTTLENIAATLYQKIGTPQHQLLNDVEKALKALIEKKYVSLKEGKYRLLGQQERTFEEKIYDRIKIITQSEKSKFFKESLKDSLSQFRIFKYKNTRDFPITIEFDDKPLFDRDAGHPIKVKIISVFHPNKKNINSLKAESSNNRNVIFLVLPDDPELVQEIEYMLAFEKVLDESRAGEEFIEEKRRELTLKKDELANAIKSTPSKGILIASGIKTDLEGKSWEEELRGAIKEAIEDVYEQFEAGNARVKETDIGKILTWQGGRLPDCYYKLKIIDEKSNTILEDESPLLMEIMRYIKEEIERKGYVLGKELIDHFEEPPYGWDPKVISLAAAALFRKGSIRIDDKPFEYGFSPKVFEQITQFKQKRITLGITLTKEDIKRASEILEEIFGISGKYTSAEVKETIIDLKNNYLKGLKALKQRIQDIGLKVPAPLTALQKVLEEIELSPTDEDVIKNFIRDDHYEIMKESVSIVDKWLKFEAKLTEVNRIKKALDEIALWNRQYADEIMDILNSEDLPDRWRSLISKFQFVKEKYEESYINAHRNAVNSLKSAEESLQSHESFQTKKSQAESILEQNPPPFNCREETVELEDLRCPNCKRSYQDLQRIPEEIERWVSRVQTLLEQLLIDTLEPLHLKRTITSENDLTGIETKLRAFIREALKKGKKVKLTLIAEEEKSERSE